MKVCLVFSELERIINVICITLDIMLQFNCICMHVSVIGALMDLLYVQRKKKRRCANAASMKEQCNSEELEHMADIQERMDDISRCNHVNGEEIDIKCSLGNGGLLKEKVLHRLQADGEENRFYADLTKYIVMF